MLVFQRRTSLNSRVIVSFNRSKRSVTTLSKLFIRQNLSALGEISSRPSFSTINIFKDSWSESFSLNYTLVLVNGREHLPISVVLRVSNRSQLSAVEEWSVLCALVTISSYRLSVRKRSLSHPFVRFVSAIWDKRRSEIFSSFEEHPLASLTVSTRIFTTLSRG